MKFTNTILLLCVTFLLSPSLLSAQRIMENLGRGVVAVNQGSEGIFIGWRLLGTDSENLAFNLYRFTEGKSVKLNDKPLTGATNFIDSKADTLKNNAWYVCPIIKGKEQKASTGFSLAAKSPVQQYMSIPLKAIAGYAPNDCSVGDLDGDGEYELIVHMTGRGRDTPSKGYTDAPIFQAYKLNGEFMWEINLGKNIREGAHYTQFVVIDMDGDGIAEFACKTGDGTIDGVGAIVGDSTKDWRDRDGKILKGPEYFTVFNGRTGAAMASAEYIPERGELGGWGGVGGNGGNDNTGNRVDRFLACAAYLDGELPSVIMCRGYYGRSVLAAWDWRDGKLTSRWVFDSKDGKNPFSGQGNHNLSVADIDNDGFDEIIYGSMAVDHDGKGVYSTGLRHGDAIHVSDLDPSRPGLEVFGVHENETNETGAGAAMFSATTGEIYWIGAMGKDAGRGVAEDIDPDYPGAEVWFSGSGGLLNNKGEKIGDNPSSTNFLIWWDGGLTRQLLNGNAIDKYKQGRIFTAVGCSSNNGTKSTPALSADIMGDWREELILRTNDNRELRIYTTTIPTEYRMYTLMHDPVYRMGIAWQNVAYNQPPHLGFWLGAGIDKIPQPNIKLQIKK